jgi:hypothetical protein
LPSSGPELVTINERMGLSTLESWMFVRSVRYASETGERGLASVTSSACSTDRADLLAARRDARHPGLGVAVGAATPAYDRVGVRNCGQQRDADETVNVFRRLEGRVKELEQE